MGQEHPLLTIEGTVRNEEDERWALWTKLVAEVRPIAERPEFADLYLMFSADDYTPTGKWVPDGD